MRASDTIPSFDYTQAEWSEIEAAAQAARRGPLPEKAMELIRAAAYDYLAETRTPPVRSARILKKRWQKLISSLERLHREFSACTEETACEMERKGHLTGEEKLRMQWLLNIRLHLKLAPGIAKTTACYFDNLDDRSNARVKYESKVLEVWVRLGGKLQISRHPKTQEIRGPLPRFFFAVARPVMGASAPAPESLRDIVRRRKKPMAELEVFAQQARRFNLLRWYDRLCERFEAENEQQARKLAIELDITRALVGADHPAVRAAERHVPNGGAGKVC